MKRRNFLKGLLATPLVAGTLPSDLIKGDTPAPVEETVPLSKVHGPMVSGGSGIFPKIKPEEKRT